MSVPALVMNIFSPSIRPAAVGRASARVRMAPASEPASGSVSPNAPSAPARRRGRAPSARAAPLVAVHDDRHRPEPGVGGDGDGHARVDPRQLLDRDRVRQRVEARAAQLLGHRHPHQAEPAERRDDRVGEAALAVELLGDRRDLALGDLAHGRAQGDLLVGEPLVHRTPAGARRSAARRWAASSRRAAAGVGPPRSARAPRRRSGRRGAPTRLGVPAVSSWATADQAAGVGDEVRDVADAEVARSARRRRRRRAGCSPSPPPSGSAGVGADVRGEHAAHRARRRACRTGCDEGVAGSSAAAAGRARRRRRRASASDVADHQPRALGREQAGDRAAPTLPTPCTTTRAPREARRAGLGLPRGPHRGQRRRGPCSGEGSPSQPPASGQAEHVRRVPRAARPCRRPWCRRPPPCSTQPPNRSTTSA